MNNIKFVHLKVRRKFDRADLSQILYSIPLRLKLKIWKISQTPEVQHATCMSMELKYN